MKKTIVNLALIYLLGFSSAEEAMTLPEACEDTEGNLLEVPTKSYEIEEHDPFAFSEEEEPTIFEEDSEHPERRLKIVKYYTTKKVTKTTTTKKTYYKPANTDYVYTPTVYKVTKSYIPVSTNIYIPSVYVPSLLYVASTSYYKPTIVTKLNIGQTCSSNVGCLSSCCKADSYGWKTCMSSLSCTTISLTSSSNTYYVYNATYVKAEGGGVAVSGGGGGLCCILIIWFMCCRRKGDEGVVVAVHHPGEKVVEEVTTTVVEEVVEEHTYDDGMPEPGFQMIPGGQPVGMPYQPPPPYGMPMHPGMMPPQGYPGHPGGMMPPPGGMMHPPGGMMQPGMHPM